MAKIEYPKKEITKKAKFSKKIGTLMQNSQLDDIKFQIDELETKSKKNDISNDDIANQVFNLQQVVTNQQNQIGANASNITNLNTTKQNTLTFDASPTLNSTNPATSGGIFSALSEKQDVLTAGANISISSQNVISANVDTTNLQNQITNLSTNKQDKLTAGTNITIDQNNQISASVNTSALQPKLTAGANINIDNTNTISASFDATNLQNQISNNYNAINNLQQTKQGVLTFDLTPTQNSNHVVTSGGVYDAIQNISGGGSCDCASDILQIKSDINKISQKIEELQSFVGYEEIVYNQDIQNNSDVYDRELEIVGTNVVYSPSVLFVTEKHLTVTDDEQNVVEYPNPINSKSEITVLVNAEGTYIFTLYDKTTIIKTVTKNFENEDLNTPTTITLNATVFNALDDHNYYIGVQAQNSATPKTIAINKLKITITAPNATILNKIHPFDVQFNYYTNKYYISDCTSGYAKLAEIDANDLHSISDIVWTQTSIEAQNYRTFFINSQDNSGTTIGKKYAAITHKNDTVTIEDLSTNTTLFSAPKGTYKLSQVFTSHNYTQFYFSGINQNTITCKYYNIYQDGSVRTANSLANESTIANIECIRTNKAYLPTNAWATCMAIKTNSVMHAYNLAAKLNEFSIDFVTDAKLYYDKTNVGTVYPYFYCYYKRFGKYYKFYAYYSGNVIQINSTTEVGEFEDFFEGANNDCFVVQNNSLQYVILT